MSAPVYLWIDTYFLAKCCAGLAQNFGFAQNWRKVTCIVIKKNDESDLEFFNKFGYLNLYLNALEDSSVNYSIGANYSISANYAMSNFAQD